MFNLNDSVDEISKKYGLNPQLLSALVQQESAGNPQARSPVGAMGLTQLMPDTAKGLGVTDPMDPMQNLDGGAKYLSQQLKAFGDPKLALAAYNAGPGNVRKYGMQVPPFKETQNYVSNIMGKLTPPPQAQDPLPSQPQQQGPESKIMSLLASMGGGNSEEQAKKEKSQNRAVMADSILSGLASVAGSFNRRRGAEFQQAPMEAYAQRQTQRQAQKESQIKNLMSLMGTMNKDTNTDDIKEFNLAKQQGFTGNLFDYQKQLKEAGRPGPDPLETAITPYMLPMIQKMFGGAQGGAGGGIPAAGGVPIGNTDTPLKRYKLINGEMVEVK